MAGRAATNVERSISHLGACASALLPETANAKAVKTTAITTKATARLLAAYTFFGMPKPTSLARCLHYRRTWPGRQREVANSPTAQAADVSGECRRHDTPWPWRSSWQNGTSPLASARGFAALAPPTQLVARSPIRSAALTPSGGRSGHGGPLATQDTTDTSSCLQSAEQPEERSDEAAIAATSKREARGPEWAAGPGPELTPAGAPCRWWLVLRGGGGPRQRRRADGSRRSGRRAGRWRSRRTGRRLGAGTRRAP